MQYRQGTMLFVQKIWHNTEVNMAVYTTINDPSAHFQVNTYTGNGNNGKVITNYGNSNLQPDFLWFKKRSNGSNRDHILVNSTDGVTKNQRANQSDAIYTNSNYVTAISSDGFTLGNGAPVNEADDDFTCWQWKGSSRADNNDGSITVDLQVNSTAGFSMGKFTPSGSSGTVGHGLGATPDFVISKGDAASGWYGMFPNAQGGNQSSGINTNNDFGTVSGLAGFNSSTFTNGNAANTYIFWAWKNTQGYFQADRYESNNNADGPFIYTGFKPALIVFKMASGGTSWRWYDESRMGYNPDNRYVLSNANDMEVNQHSGNAEVHFLSNGFKLTEAEGDINYNSETVCYAAWAKSPFVTSTGIPTTTR